MFKYEHTWFWRSAIVLIATITFIPFLGQVHLFDWDEINFAEAAREMVITNNFTTISIDFEPFWEKPPLFFWMQVFSMKLFGISEFAARFPNAIAGIITLLLFFEIGRKLKNNQFGITWALIYLTSILPHFYFVSGIIDPWFNLFIFLSVYFIFRFYNEAEHKNRLIFISGLFVGLSVLTKGPVGLLLMGLTWATFILIKKLKPFPSIKHLITFLIGAGFVGGLWILSETIQGRFYIVKEFFDYQIRLLNTQDAGHGGPIYYHALVLLIGCFPMSVFALKHLTHRAKVKQFQRFEKWMRYLFWVVLIIFSLVNTKIIHYSSMCYFPLSFFAAVTVFENVRFKEFNPIVKWLAFGFGALWMILLFGLAYVGNNWHFLPQIIEVKDVFVQELFRFPSTFQPIDYLPSVLMLLALILFLFLKTTKQKLVVLFGGTFLAITLAFGLIVPKVEYFSQGGAIDFYKGHQKELVFPLKHKSYAHLFYTQKPKEFHHVSVDQALNPSFNQKALFVVKANHKTEIENSYPHLKPVGNDRGFYFYQSN